MPQALKQCAKCRRKLTLKHFCKDSSRPDGYHNYCKECLSGKRNPTVVEKRREYRKEYYKRNRDRLLQYQREYIEKKKALDTP